MSQEVSTHKSQEPLRLKLEDSWQDIEDLIKSGALPMSLGLCLKSVLTCSRLGYITPEARPHLVKLAKEHLSGGIILTSERKDEWYDLVVFEPDGSIEKSKRSFFWLIPKYPGGSFKYLKDAKVE